MKYVASVVLGALAVSAHYTPSYPTIRGDPHGLNEIGDVARGADNVSPCGSDNTETTVPAGNTFARGEKLNLKWYRNNHYGGFVRWSIIPMAASPTREDFNKPENIISYQCFSPPTCESYNTFDNDWEYQCTGIDDTIPTYLADGKYVANVAFYDQFDSYGNPNAALEFYSNCMNLEIKGGVAQTEQSAHVANGVFNDNEAIKDGKEGVCKYKGDSPAFPFDGIDTSLNNDVNNMKYGVPAEFTGAPAGSAAPVASSAPAAGAASSGSGNSNTKVSASAPAGQTTAASSKNAGSGSGAGKSSTAKAPASTGNPSEAEDDDSDDDSDDNSDDDSDDEQASILPTVDNKAVVSDDEQSGSTADADQESKGAYTGRPAASAGPSAAPSSTRTHRCRRHEGWNRCGGNRMSASASYYE